MKKKIFIFVLCLLGLTCLISACKALDTDLDRGTEIHFAAYTKYEGGKVEKQGETQTVRVGDSATLRAVDTDEYTFSHWERLNQIVSTEREYTFQVREPDLDFRKYYAVFTPKDPNKALVNLICENGETIDDDLVRLERFEVSGGGYYTVGETATLQSTENGVGLVRTFSYNGSTVDGPILSLPIEGNITITATLEKMVEITALDNGVIGITLQSEDEFLTEEENLRVAVESYEGEYVPDTWFVKDIATGKVLYDRLWEEHTVLELPITHREISLYRRLSVELTCTNENLADTLPVEVVSVTGDPVQVEVEQPEKFIIGRAYPIWVKPDENTYIQSMYIRNSEPDTSPAWRRDDLVQEESIYTRGGETRVYDPGVSYGFEWRVVFDAIPKEKAAIVHIVSDDEPIEEYRKETGKNPSGYVAPKLSTNLMIVEKNKESYFYLRYEWSLFAIYEIGWQFWRVEDEKGRAVADNINFSFTVNEDTNYYLKWKLKPVFDLYFDYELTDDETGYRAKLSQLACYGSLCPFVKELALPYSYNGKPVKEIADYGMSSYRCYRKESGQEWCSYLPFEKFVLPYTVERIGEKAFASPFVRQVVLPESDQLAYISPDAFYSPNNSVNANLSRRHIESILQDLHDSYIGGDTRFVYALQNDAHFDGENGSAHVEENTEFICVKESIFTEKNTAIQLAVLYEAFFRHYQRVALEGVGKENLENMKLRPSDEELLAWSTPFDSTDLESRWNHPLEVSVRAFVTGLTGFVFTKN